MNIKYRPDIDGLRAIAVLSVIAYHLNSHWLHGGFVGVDVFFVISGYLITKIIYTDIVTNQFSFKVFYQRRINRILPTFFIVMLATSIGAWYVLQPDEFMLYLRSLKSTTYFWENMFFAKKTGGYWDISAEKMPILHTWSLAVEEQFYILLPFLLLFLCGIKLKKRKLLNLNKKSVLIVLAIVAFVSFYIAQTSPSSAFLTKYNYYSLFTARAGELLIGSIIGIISVISSKSDELNKRPLWINNILSFIGFVAMILSIIFISKNILFPSFIALIPNISVALVIYFYDSRTYIARFLSLKPVVFIGKISFSMYLWHWPLIVLTKQYLFLDDFDATWHYLLVISLTFILSVFTYFLVETPCRKYKKSFKFSFIIYYLIPAIAIIGTYKTEQKTRFLINFRYKERLVLYDLQKQYLNPTVNFCNQKIIGSCIFGDKSKKPNIFMFGDSHAGHYSPYIDEAGKRYGFAVKIINAHACEFNDIQIKNKLIKHGYEQFCQKSMEYVSKEIDNYNVIILAFRNDSEGVPENGKKTYLINDTLLRLTNKYKNKKFVILGQVPVINNNIHDKFMYYFIHGKTLIKAPFLNGSEKDANNSVKRTAKNIATYLEPLSYLDDDSKQNWPIYKGLIGYSYDSHLGEYVTRRWSQEVLPKQKEFWENIAKIANQE